MISRIDHYSFTVSNLERSTAFYRDILGMKVIFDSKAAGIQFKGPWADKITGCPGTELCFIVLAIGDSLMELVEYSPKGKPQVDNNASDTGSAHVAFKTEDIQEFYRRLSANKVRLHGPPQHIGFAWVMYFRDPDGNILEAVQGELPP